MDRCRLGFRTSTGTAAVAATAVVLYHSVPWITWPTASSGYGLDWAAWIESLGKYGVAVFFLLSGLVLYRPYVSSALARRPGPAVWPFYSRRVLRIYPAWVLALTLWHALGNYVLVGELSPGQYLWQYTLLQTHVDGGMAASLGVGWTLSIEITFYLTLPLIACRNPAAPRR